MRALIEAVAALLPGPLRRLVMLHVALLAEVVQFGTVGAIGFVVDTAVVYALRGANGLYVAGAAAYVVAVTTTWWLNRVWTFRGRGAHTPRHLQWMRFVAANLPGLVLNLGTYFSLVAVSTVCATYPVLAVAAGAIAGMTSNFLLAKTVVFQ